MYDGIRLRLSSPLVKVQHSLNPGPIDTESGVLQVGGVFLRQVNGNRFYANRTIYEDGLNGVYGAHGHIYLRTNLPRIKSHGGSNLVPVTKSELPGVIQWLQDEMDRIGLVTDIRRAWVSKLEIFANAQTKYSFQDFRPLFDILDIPRRTKTVFPNSYTFFNTQRADIFYDKRAKLMERGQCPADLPATIRVEQRFKNAATVKPIGVVTFDDLETKWDSIQAQFVTNARKILRYDDDLPEVLDLGNMMALVRSQKKAKQALFARALLQQEGSLEAIRSDLALQKVPKRTINRLMESVIAGIQFPVVGDPISLNDLKQELYAKLLEGLGGGEPKE